MANAVDTLSGVGPPEPTVKHEPDTVMSDVTPTSGVPPAGAPPAGVPPVDTVAASTIPNPAKPGPLRNGTHPPDTPTTPATIASTAASEAEPLPTKAQPHGAPARQYLNEKVTPSLLEGMKRLAAEKPDNPLRVLGEFLITRSKELEGS